MKTEAGSQKLEARSLIFWAILLALVTWPLSLVTPLALAQPGGGQGGRFMEKQEKLQTLITMRLTSEVGLTQDQALKVSEIMKKYHLQRRTLHQKIQSLNQQLRMAADSNDPKQASQVISDLQKAKDEMDQLDDQMFKEVKPMLNPQQQAKFLLVIQDVRREMMQLRRGGGMGMGGGGGPSNSNSSGPSK